MVFNSLSRRLPNRALFGFILLGIFCLAGCADLNNPYPSGGYGGYSDPYYGGNNYESRRDWERERWEERERRRLERERRHLDEDRRRFDAEQEAASHHSPPPPPPPAESELRCPPGTHPSTHRCTKEERKKGCKDYGAPGGRGCSNF